MDEATVKQHAEAHGQAVMVRNLREAAQDIAPEAGAQARQVMAELPDPTTTVEVTDVRADGDACVVTIRYGGDSEEVDVRSRWAERDGRPKIVELSVV
jgi:hypothetical protein